MLYFTRRDFTFISLFFFQLLFLWSNKFSYTKPNHLLWWCLSEGVNNALRDGHCQGELLSNPLKVEYHQLGGLVFTHKGNWLAFLCVVLYLKTKFIYIWKLHRSLCWMTQYESTLFLFRFLKFLSIL